MLHKGTRDAPLLIQVVAVSPTQHLHLFRPRQFRTFINFAMYVICDPGRHSREFRVPLNWVNSRPTIQKRTTLVYKQLVFVFGLRLGVAYTAILATTAGLTGTSDALVWLPSLMIAVLFEFQDAQSPALLFLFL